MTAIATEKPTQVRVPTRGRNITELYVRAYWRVYLLSGAWAFTASMLGISLTH